MTFVPVRVLFRWPSVQPTQYRLIAAHPSVIALVPCGQFLHPVPSSGSKSGLSQNNSDDHNTTILTSR